MNGPQRFRVKPVEIEAMSWSGLTEDAHPIIQWINSSGAEFTAVWREYQPYSSGGLFPQTAQERVEEGIYIKRASSWREDYVGANFWVTLDDDGVFRAVKPDVFAATYEAVES